MTQRYDIAIAGSGFAGSIMAMIAARLGLAVVLIERGRHPRVVIGESSTPLSNLLLEQLADTYGLSILRSLSKWGTWQQHHPDLPCGLKRGFTFFHHDVNGKQTDATDRQLLVAASPNEAIADTHWFRADLDHYLVRQACTLGVTYLDECVVHDMDRQGDAWAIQCEHQGTDDTVHARFIIDATGPRGLLHRVLGLGEATLPSYPETSAVYGHFTGVKTSAEVQQYASGTPPYPPDDAALHHVFDGGWMWVLRFNNGWTSAGVAATRAVADRLRLQEKEAAWQGLLDTLPEVKEQFGSACAVRPFTYVPQLSFRSAQMSGPGWAMLPSAAGFVDPAALHRLPPHAARSVAPGRDPCTQLEHLQTGRQPCGLCA